MDRHSRDVAAIASAMKGFYEQGESFRMNHGSTNSTRQSVLERRKTIDIGHLRYVLNIDVAQKTALVEPNVPMDRLVQTTLKYGLIPPVVMEFPGITVGGGYAGTSGESSSFKHGFFDRTINYVEIVLADGEVVTASRSERSDLFHGAAGACGSLGVTTLVELELIEAKKYVQTTYWPVWSVQEAVETIEDVIRPDEGYDYVDGILSSADRGAIITGRLTDEKGSGRVQRFANARDPWFYLHVQDSISRSNDTVTEYIPLEDYLFRYDRGGFWVGRSAYQYFFTPFNRFTRWFLDDFTRTRMMYTALHASGHSKQYVVQDLAVPFSKAVEFIDFTDQTFNIYPLWLCPLRQSPQPTFHPHTKEDEQEHLLNVGLWGNGPSDHDAFVRINQLLENKLRELGGMKWLYAHTYYSAKEFWSIYGSEWYDNLRSKYKAASLPDVYQKVTVDVEAEKRAVRDSWGLWILTFWPISGLWGLWVAFRSGQYLLADRKRWRSIEEKDRDLKTKKG